MRKIIFLVLDGAAGTPSKTLGNMTCLENAKTPGIDSLFNKSINGLMNVVSPNIAPESDVATFALLGYNPFNVPARGVTEAIGAGISYVNGELAIRCNIANVQKGKIVKFRLSKLSNEKGKEIEKLLNEGISLSVPFTFKHTKDYRGVLVLHEKLSSNVTNTHPGYIRERVGEELINIARNVTEGVSLKECKPLSPDAKRTAELINDFSLQAFEILSKVKIKDDSLIEANYVLTRDAGNSLPVLESFNKKYKLNFSLVAEMPTEIGIAKILGLNVLSEASNMQTLAKNVSNELKRADGVYVHIKGPDKYGHLGDAYSKTKEIERIDNEFVKPLLTLIDLTKTTICITSDHSTPPSIGGHSNDPVPYLISNDEINPGHFFEGNVRKEFINGVDLINKIISTAKSA